ncbi:MAG: M50 family metallopeptidase [Hyphomonadaceae bacterium]
MSSILAQGPLFLIPMILMLGVVVVVHELGHYWAARLFGGAAESFSIGFGRSIFEVKDKRNTRWRINWIPFGGFVKFVGEAQTAGDIGKIETGPVGKAFMEMTVWQRSIIAAAGPIANFVLASVLFAIVALNNDTPVQRMVVTEVLPGPAADAGLQEGDALLGINGKETRRGATLIQKIMLSSGTPVRLSIERDGALQDISVTPVRVDRDNGLGQIQSVGSINVRLSAEQVDLIDHGPISAIWVGIARTADTLDTTVNMLGRLVTGREPISQLSGPIGIGDISRRAVNATMGVETVSLGRRLAAVGWLMVNICAFVSVGIGLFNLLPLPVLDGGHLVFNAYEAITGKLMPEKIQELSLRFGMVLLLGVAAIVTWSDIVETGIFGSLGS